MQLYGEITGPEMRNHCQLTTMPLLYDDSVIYKELQQRLVSMFVGSATATTKGHSIQRAGIIMSSNDVCGGGERLVF